jgi:hypothetical protein
MAVTLPSLIETPSLTILIIKNAQARLHFFAFLVTYYWHHTYLQGRATQVTLVQGH